MSKQLPCQDLCFYGLMQQEELHIRKFGLDFVETQQNTARYNHNITPKPGAQNWGTHTPSDAREKIWGYASKFIVESLQKFSTKKQIIKLRKDKFDSYNKGFARKLQK